MQVFLKNLLKRLKIINSLHKAHKKINEYNLNIYI